MLAGGIGGGGFLRLQKSFLRMIALIIPHTVRDDDKSPAKNSGT